MNNLTSFKNLVELLQRFDDENVCRNYVKSVLWKCEHPPACPKCGHTKTYSFKDGQTYKCAGCRKKFNVLTGTVFENTKIPLQKWFAAMYLATSHKRGVSSYQLARDIGVTQKTAYFMLQRIRVMFENVQPEALEGVCSADETYVGGKQKNKHKDKRTPGQQGRGSSEKISVFGVMQVGGNVKSVYVTDVSGKTLRPLVEKYVKPGSTMMTDEWQAYNGLSKSYTHLICDHGRYQYVSETGATTNHLENYWSIVKRTMMGTYYHFSRKHAPRYLAEFDYRFNSRHQTEHGRFAITMANCRGRLKWQDLIKNP